MDCIFCKIANKEMPNEIVFESDNLIAFNDINPKAEVHILVTPKKHIVSMAHLEEKDQDLMGELIMAVQKIAKDKNLKCYKVLNNCGRECGQIIDHLHFHLIGKL